MSVEYLREWKHDATVAEIAKVKFPFPNEEFPDLETIVNEPTPRISIGTDGTGELYPDIVVVKKPGQWLRLIAEVATEETMTDEAAKGEWKQFGELGELYLYVPTGCGKKAKDLCRKHGVKVKGIRTWRYRPVWGLAVSEAV
ncbi:MAG: hypothetical protein WEC33_04535 [Dehalococcoidia bacterium]